MADVRQRPPGKTFVAAFRRAAEGALESLGAVRLMDVSASRWRVETARGGLEVTVRADWIACRFDDPKRAAAQPPAGPSVNPHSGKWNHHLQPRSLSLVESFRDHVAPLVVPPASGSRCGVDARFAYAFVAAGDEALEALGARHLGHGPFRSTWSLDTVGGELEVTILAGWISCRFADPTAAEPHFPPGAIDAESGLWNHHWWDADHRAPNMGLVTQVATSIGCILPERQPAPAG